MKAQPHGPCDFILVSLVHFCKLMKEHLIEYFNNLIYFMPVSKYNQYSAFYGLRTIKQGIIIK